MSTFGTWFLCLEKGRNSLKWSFLVLGEIPKKYAFFAVPSVSIYLVWNFPYQPRCLMPTFLRLHHTTPLVRQLHQKYPGKKRHLPRFFPFSPTPPQKKKASKNQNITPQKKTSDTSPKKITILWLYPKKNLNKHKHNHQPTNKPTTRYEKKKNDNDETDDTTSSFRRLSLFLWHLYQGQTLVETSLHLILPALSLPFGRVVVVITVVWFLPGPSPSFHQVDFVLTRWVVFNQPIWKNMRKNVNCWVDVPNLSQERGWWFRLKSIWNHHLESCRTNMKRM